MKNKILIISLFLILALPIPVAKLGFILTSSWLFGSLLMEATPFVELICAITGMIIAGTYVISYAIALIKTLKEKKISKKSFLPVVHCVVAVIYLMLLSPAANFVDQTREHFGFAKIDFTVVEEVDTHGGFHGDGSYYLILDCSDNKQKALNKLKNWNKLPMSENVDRIMFGSERNGDGLAEEAHMPVINNGYYMFKDRHSDSKDRTDDSEFLDRHSYNFSVALYDSDTDKMYYFEFDT